MQAKYKRVILKISGEALSSEKANIDFDIVHNVAKQIVEATKIGVEVGVIVGGGNIWRGRAGKGMDRTTADHMGMLATVINALALSDAINSLGAVLEYRRRLRCGRLQSHILEEKRSGI